MRCGGGGRAVVGAGFPEVSFTSPLQPISPENAFWLRASERPCQFEVKEVLWWWWQGGSRGEVSRSFFHLAPIAHFSGKR